MKEFWTQLTLRMRENSWKHIARLFSACFPPLVDIIHFLKPSRLLKRHVLICRDAIKRSILAQYIIPYFKADISLFPKGDRLTQISLYISLLHHDWQSRVAKFKIKKNGRNVCCIYSHQLTQQLAHDKLQDRNIVYLPVEQQGGTNQQHKKKENRNKIRQNYVLR